MGGTKTSISKGVDNKRGDAVCRGDISSEYHVGLEGTALHNRTNIEWGWAADRADHVGKVFETPSGSTRFTPAAGIPLAGVRELQNG